MWIGRVAPGVGTCALDQALGELLLDRALDEDALDRRATLPGVAEAALGGEGDRELEVAV